MMQLTIPLEVLAVLHTLTKAGYDAYIVGGAVRDLVRAVPAVDFDFTTNATPEQIQALFPESFYENEFGTVSITPHHLRAQLALPTPPLPLTPPSPSNRIIDLASATKLHQSLTQQASAVAEAAEPPYEEPYEITTYRSEGSYSDHRRPDAVAWGTSIADDLSRRDFTINAMAISVSPEYLNSVLTSSTTMAEYTAVLSTDHFSFIDPYHGQDDLAADIIQTVGDPSQRFQEDALRMLRAIRFAAQLRYTLTEPTRAAITQHAGLLRHVSLERIRDEFGKMLISSRPKAAIEALAATGLLATFLPELLQAQGVQQGGHHTTDVWTHSLDALENCPSSDVVVRLATLLHDISKPETYALSNGQPTFYNHEVVGSRVAKRIAERLKFSRRDCERIFILVRFHMFHYQPENSDAAIRRFMRKVGLAAIDDILDVREADRLGSGARKTSWRLEEMKERMIEQLHQPLDVTDLALNGNDLMTELSLAPGPVIGKLLQGLFEIVLEQPEANTREKLLELARAELATQTSSSK